jgi:microcompartment protein CcmK/EutM
MVLDILLYGFFWVLCASTLGAVIAFLSRRFGRPEGRQENNVAVGHVLTIVSGLHVVLVALVLITLFDAVGEAEEAADREAAGLVSATWAAASLPEPAGALVRGCSASYAGAVIRQEWPRMRVGVAVPTRGWEWLDDMRAAVVKTQADNGWQVSRKAVAMEQISRVYQARQVRISAVDNGGAGVVVWFLLIIGSAAVIILSNLFGGTKPVTHILVVSTLSGIVALLLFAVHELENPFGEGVALGPTAFLWALDRVS